MMIECQILSCCSRGGCIGEYCRIRRYVDLARASEGSGKFGRVSEHLGEFGRLSLGFGKLLEPSAEVRKVWECFGMLGRDFERLGVSVEEGIGAFG